MLKTGLKVEKTGDLFRKFGLLFIIILMMAVMSIISPVFFTSGNLINVLRQISINGILAVGVTFVILTGGIDLSVGSMIAASGVVAGSLLLDGHSPVVAILAAMAIAVLFGTLNGVMIAFLGLPPFIATLATQVGARGFSLVYSNGRPYAITNEPFMEVGKGSSLGVPNPIWILLFVCVLAFCILKFTIYGRHVYAFGGNRNATKLAGVRTRLVECSVYMLSGFLASIAAIILAARISSGQPTAGSGFELDAIAAVAIGGTSMAGGVGSIAGTVMGFCIIGIMNNSLTLLNVSSFYQQIVQGLIIVIAVLIDIHAKKKSV